MKTFDEDLSVQVFCGETVMLFADSWMVSGQIP